MKMRLHWLVLGTVVVSTTACVKSDWKIEGGPHACQAMCRKWGLEFTAMVGVGDQEDQYGEGATACVCQPRHLVRTAAEFKGGSSSSASLAGPISAEQAAAAAAAHRVQQQSNNPISTPQR